VVTAAVTGILAGGLERDDFSPMLDNSGGGSPSGGYCVKESQTLRQPFVSELFSPLYGSKGWRKLS
jgi:hypothetical protein